MLGLWLIVARADAPGNPVRRFITIGQHCGGGNHDPEPRIMAQSFKHLFRPSSVPTAGVASAIYPSHSLCPIAIATLVMTATKRKADFLVEGSIDLDSYFSWPDALPKRSPATFPHGRQAKGNALERAEKQIRELQELEETNELLFQFILEQKSLLSLLIAYPTVRFQC